MNRNKDRGLEETEYLVRSPKNAERLRESLREAEEGKSTPDTVENLRHSLGLSPKKK
jgi:hypothetical protein